jgi:hypothetical protein
LKDGYPKLTLFKVFSFCKSDERLWVISGVFSSKKKKKKKSGVFSIILELSNFHNNQNIERYFSKNKNKKIEQYTIYIYIYILTNIRSFVEGGSPLSSIRNRGKTYDGANYK